MPPARVNLVHTKPIWEQTFRRNINWKCKLWLGVSDWYGCEITDTFIGAMKPKDRVKRAYRYRIYIYIHTEKPYNCLTTQLLTPKLNREAILPWLSPAERNNMARNQLFQGCSRVKAWGRWPPWSGYWPALGVWQVKGALLTLSAGGPGLSRLKWMLVHLSTQGCK